MKKFLPYILILIILVGVFSPVFHIYADNNSGQSLTAGSSGKTDTGWCFSASGCFWDLISVVSSFILKIAAFILWLAGMILNFVLTYTIIDMAAHINGGIGSFSNEPILALTGINIAWKIIRDLMNIAFIFMLVYEGIKMIIGQSDTGKAKSFISGIVLASLLINFSLFFTKVMIDASNIVTIGLYNSVITEGTAGIPTGTPGSPGVTARNVGGLSAPFMNALGLSNFYSTNSFSSTAGNEENLVIFHLMGAIVFVVVAFVFFAITALFVVRYVTLIILLMLSPLAYMGMALPFMRSYASEWWKSLNGQLLFAPIYMVMNVVILTLMSSDGFISKNGNWGDLLKGGTTTTSDNSAIGLIFNFVVIIGLVIASLVIAKKTATDGSKFIGQASGNLTKFAGSAVMGGAANIGRNTIGRAGNALANSERLKSLAFKTNEDGTVVARSGIGGFAARSAIKTSNTAAKSAFDVRSTGTFGTLAKTAGVDFGKGDDSKKVNFQEDLKNKGKKEVEFAKMLKPVDDDEAKKIAREKLYNTETYKKLKEDETEAKEEEGKHIKELDELNKKKRDLEERLKTALPGTEHIIKEDLVKTEDEIKAKDVHTEKIKTASENAAKARAEAVVKAENVYGNRVEAYAQSIEQGGLGGVISRYGGTVAKITGGVVGGAMGGALLAVPGAAAGGAYSASSASYTTKTDARAIAAAIRKGTKEKSTEEKMKELIDKRAEEIAEEDKKKKEEEGGGDKKEEKTEEKKEEPKPEAPKTP